MRNFIVFTLIVFTVSLYAQEVKWYSIEEAIELNKTQPKNFIVDIHSGNSSAWKKTNKKTFKNQVIANYLNQKYYPVLLNSEYKEDIIIEQDTFRYNPKEKYNYHELAYSLLDSNMGNPAFIFLNKDIQVIYTQKAFDNSLTIDSLLRYIDENEQKLTKRNILSTTNEPEPIQAAEIKSINKDANIKWYTIEEAVELNKTQPKKILIDVYTDWCGWCKIMDKKTFQHPIIASYLNEKFYPVKFNAEQKEDVIIGSDTLRYIPQGARGVHELAALLLNNKLSYPSVVFLNEQIQIIHTQSGFIKAIPFDTMIKYLGGNHFATESWESWNTTYNSPIQFE